MLAFLILLIGLVEVTALLGHGSIGMKTRRLEMGLFASVSFLKNAIRSFEYAILNNDFDYFSQRMPGRRYRTATTT